MHRLGRPFLPWGGPFSFKVPKMKSFREALGGRTAMLVLFLPPALLLFTVFVMLPLGQAMLFAPFKWTGFGPNPWTVNPATGQAFGEWVGTQNFERLAQNSAFGTAFANTMLVVLVSLFVQLPLALVLALLIADKTRSNTAFRLIFFLPFILSEVATGLIWSFVFDGNYGITRYVADATGQGEAFFPLADKNWAFPTILLVIVWKFFGFHMMIFIAALQGLPKDVIEAAKVDGAGPWQAALFVKIPMIWPAMTVSIFYSVLGSLQIFDLIMPMTGGGPSNASQSLVSYLYTFGVTRQQAGFGSAVGVVIFVVAVIFAFTYRRTVQRGIAQ